MTSGNPTKTNVSFRSYQQRETYRQHYLRAHCEDFWSTLRFKGFWAFNLPNACDLFKYDKSKYNFRVINWIVYYSILPGTRKTIHWILITNYYLLAELNNLETSKWPPKSIVDFLHFGPKVNFDIVICMFLAYKEFDGLLINIEIVCDDKANPSRSYFGKYFDLKEGSGRSERVGWKFLES